MSNKIAKTNALRLLDAQHIPYQTHTYTVEDDLIDGKSVCEKVGLEPHGFFKTLVAQTKTRQILVYVIPINCELDLKKAAQAAGEKSVELLAVKDLLSATGYVRGGCSPIGMKKKYITYLDLQINSLDRVQVSAGKKGLLLDLSARALLELTAGHIADLTAPVQSIDGKKLQL